MRRIRDRHPKALLALWPILFFSALLSRGCAPLQGADLDPLIGPLSETKHGRLAGDADSPHPAQNPPGTIDVRTLHSLKRGYWKPVDPYPWFMIRTQTGVVLYHDGRHEEAVTSPRYIPVPTGFERFEEASAYYRESHFDRETGEYGPGEDLPWWIDGQREPNDPCRYCWWDVFLNLFEQGRFDGYVMYQVDWPVWRKQYPGAFYVPGWHTINGVQVGGPRPINPETRMYMDVPFDDHYNSADVFHAWPSEYRQQLVEGAKKPEPKNAR
jgi:hypothetical protein